jgi:hypothetical protein
VDAPKHDIIQSPMYTVFFPYTYIYVIKFIKLGKVKKKLMILIIKYDNYTNIL